MKLQQPMVSVIIPACNEEKRLPIMLKKLAEIKAHDYSNLEVIVCINGSRDPSGLERIAKEHGARSVDSAKGPSAARNAGARRAKGEILVFVDTDVQLPVGIITDIVNATDEHSVGTCTTWPNVENSKAVLATQLKNFVRSVGLIKGMSELVFCHRKLFTERGIQFNPTLKLGEIHDFFVRAVKDGGCHYKYMRRPVKETWRYSVDRYERIGYVRNALFWFRWWFFTQLLRQSPRRFEQEYWGS